MADEQSPPVVPPEVKALVDNLKTVDRAAGLAMHRPLVEGAAMAVAHAARKHRVLRLLHNQVAKRDGADSPAAKALEGAMERQQTHGISVLESAINAAAAFPAQEPGVLEMLGFKPQDFANVDLPWPGGSGSGSPPEGSPG